MLGACSMRRMRYRDIVVGHVRPLSRANRLAFVLSSKETTAACPAEFPPPTTMTSSFAES